VWKISLDTTIEDTDMFLDSEIEYWAELYINLGISEYKLSFDSFLVDPHLYLKEFGQESATECINNGFEPLLPAQARVALSIRELDTKQINLVQNKNITLSDCDNDESSTSSEEINENLLKKDKLSRDR